MPKHIPDVIRGDARTLQVCLDGKPLSPKASQKVWNHSPEVHPRLRGEHCDVPPPVDGCDGSSPPAVGKK